MFSEPEELGGTLDTGTAARAAAAEDFGRIVHRPPAAVVTPRTAGDVAAVLRFAGERAIPVAPRGTGHSTYGQAQAPGGIVIDMTGLNRVHEVTEYHVVADAGARWSDVLKTTLPRGLTPPVLPDFLDLSVGGTLSVGGVGGTSHRHGAQVDDVLALDVVTGAGDMRSCSAEREPGLFRAVLAGLGQVAVITRATLRLIPAKDLARVHRLHYTELAPFLAEQERLMEGGRFDYLEGQIKFADDGGWDFMVEAAQFHGAQTSNRGRWGWAPTSCRRRANQHVAGRNQQAPLGSIQQETVDLTHKEFLNRLDEGVEYLFGSGDWFDPHPWLNVILPAAAVPDFVALALDGLTQAEVGPGPILVYPMRRKAPAAPLLRFPEGRTAYLVAILRTVPPGRDGVARVLARNRELLDAATGMGGFRYPVDSVTWAAPDWRAHFGEVWDMLAEAKRVHDPNKILTPGQCIF